MAELQNRMVPFVFDERLMRAMLRAEDDFWFVAKDACAILGLENVSQAISFLDDDEKFILTNSEGNPRAGIPRQLNLISESGLYALIFRSRKPEAKAFAKWVRSEVLPSIRKTGGYGLSGTAPHTADTAARFSTGTMPPDLESLEEALCLPSNTRRHLWGQALQTARLEGAGIDVALKWFRFLCRMTTERKPQTDKWRCTEQFMDECLESVRGERISFGAVYAAYQAWWQRNRLGDFPSQRFLSSVLKERFSIFKSNSMQVRNCALKNFSVA